MPSPIRFILASGLAICVLAASARAQPALPAGAPPVPGNATPAAQTTPPASSAQAREAWRDTSGYPWPALADTVAAAQNMAYAMNLREYCANARIASDFVRARLARFSQITGREETCKSLLDY
ncbi:MAG: hypothetical protein LBI92_06380 [Azoarcus sp.]|jgi:hypothetical protein|nr:hypothetical protein [Azoarcus sp.]